MNDKNFTNFGNLYYRDTLTCVSLKYSEPVLRNGVNYILVLRSVIALLRSYKLPFINFPSNINRRGLVRAPKKQKKQKKPCMN